MWGGHHPTAAPDEVISESWVDILCRGEGDIALSEVVQRLESGKSLNGVANLFYKEDGEVVRELLLSFVEDLDALPFEDRKVFDYDKIVKTRDGWAEVIVTRGCPYPCSYCFNLPLFNQYKKDIESTRGHSLAMKEVIRRRSVDATIRMLKEMKKEYPDITGITFVDDVMAREGQWLEDFVRRYPKEIGLPYACTSQPLLFSETIAEQLKSSGCKVVKMGIEAGNIEIRKKVLKRNISDELLIKVFDIANKYGLKPQSFNMIGIPGESIENMMETVRLNARIKPYIVWLSTFNPYPGTELYQQCVEKGMIDESKWQQVDSYRGSTVLKEQFLPSLEFKKFRVLFRWLLNVNLGNEAGVIYQQHVDEFMSLDREQWETDEAETKFVQRDAELDVEMKKKDISHYVSKKYINILWGKEYDYDLS